MFNTDPGPDRAIMALAGNVNGIADVEPERQVYAEMVREIAHRSGDWPRA